MKGKIRCKEKTEKGKKHEKIKKGNGERKKKDIKGVEKGLR